MKLIFLGGGRFVKVDDCDFHWLSQTKWYYNKRGYAVGDILGGRRGSGKILMHRLILLAPNTATVDHKNHDTLDNRRRNLRLATRTQQNANRARTHGASRYKGVHRRWDGLKWVAQIGNGDHRSTLGSFEAEEDAARCYNAVARHVFGEFANYNKVTPKFPSKKDCSSFVSRWENGAKPRKERL